MVITRKPLVQMFWNLVWQVSLYRTIIPEHFKWFKRTVCKCYCSPKLRPYVSTFFRHQSLYMWNYLHNTDISSRDKTSTHRRHANHIRDVNRYSGLSDMLSKWWELLDQGLKSNLPSINKNLESSIINIDTYIIANFPLQADVLKVQFLHLVTSIAANGPHYRLIGEKCNFCT